MRQEKEKAATDCDRLSLDLERAATQHNKAQTGLDRSQEEVARLQVQYKLNFPLKTLNNQNSSLNFYVCQVELEKLYDKHDKTQMELRKAHGELEKYKSETAALEAEVDRFAARMGKYQENEEKMTEDLTR